MSPDVAKWCSEEKAEGLLSGTLMTYPNKHCSWTDLETLEVTGTESDPDRPGRADAPTYSKEARFTLEAQRTDTGLVGGRTWVHLHRGRGRVLASVFCVTW